METRANDFDRRNVYQRKEEEEVLIIFSVQIRPRKPRFKALESKSTTKYQAKTSRLFSIESNKIEKIRVTCRLMRMLLSFSLSLDVAVKMDEAVKMRRYPNL